MAIGVGGAILASSAISAAGSGASGAAGASQSQSSARRARKFTREVMQNQRQWLADDLRKAGINPMLASGASPTGHGSGGQTINVPDPKLDLIGSAQKAQSIKNQEEENRIIKAEADEKEASSALEVDIINELRKKDNIGPYVRSKILGTGSIATTASLVTSLLNSLSGKKTDLPEGGAPPPPPKPTPKPKQTRQKTHYH